MDAIELRCLALLVEAGILDAIQYRARDNEIVPIWVIGLNQDLVDVGRLVDEVDGEVSLLTISRTVVLEVVKDISSLRAVQLSYDIGYFGDLVAAVVDRERVTTFDTSSVPGLFSLWDWEAPSRALVLGTVGFLAARLAIGHVVGHASLVARSARVVWAMLASWGDRSYQPTQADLDALTARVAAGESFPLPVADDVVRRGG